MGLEDIYQHNVNKTSINQTGISSGMPATRERDPQQVKLTRCICKNARSCNSSISRRKSPTGTKCSFGWT